MVTYAPLSSSFMAIALLGLASTTILSAFGTFSATVGFTFGLFFVMMLISSLISTTKAPLGGLEKKLNK